MRFIIDQPNDSPLNILRRAGYAFLRKNEQTGEMSFAKRVGHADFPRFHIYSKVFENGSAQINLHLDQKKASYEGTTAHSGEYGAQENKWLEYEANLIKKEFAK